MYNKYLKLRIHDSKPELAMMDHISEDGQLIEPTVCVLHAHLSVEDKLDKLSIIWAMKFQELKDGIFVGSYK